MDSAQRKLLIITAPSGAGKTSVTNYLLGLFPRLAFSISATTRQPRENETNGVEYYFLSTEAFDQKIRNNEFVEWEMVYEGKYYGTLKSEMDRIWESGRVPVLDIDVKGAIHVRQQYPESTLSIFIEPPSIEELRRRLTGRGTETKESLESRLSKAAYEISFKHSFSHTIVNHDLQTAREEAAALVRDFLSPENRDFTAGRS